MRCLERLEKRKSFKLKARLEYLDLSALKVKMKNLKGQVKLLTNLTLS